VCNRISTSSCHRAKSIYMISCEREGSASSARTQWAKGSQYFHLASRYYYMRAAFMQCRGCCARICAVKAYTSPPLVRTFTLPKFQLARRRLIVRCFACDFEEAKKVVKSCVDTLARCFVSKQTKMYNKNERDVPLDIFLREREQLFFRDAKESHFSRLSN
jgi:hypothetical protein